jgi:hypothetical protein
MSRSVVSRCAVFLAVTLAGCSGSQMRLSSDPIGGTTSAHASQQAPVSGENVYVANQTHEGPPWVGEVLVFPVGSNGNVAPIVTIGGSNTLLTQANGIVVDGSGTIYVANSDTNIIVGFPAGSFGNVSPTVNIGGTNTGLASPLGMAIDASGNLYVANCGTACSYGPPGTTSIEEFAAGSNGNVAPIRVISGKRAAFGGRIKGIALDRSGVISVAGWDADAAISFGPNKNGNTYPSRVVSGSLTRIGLPDGIASTANGIYVASNVGPLIGRFRVHANGNVRPKDELKQPTTGGIYGAPDGTIYAAGLGVSAIYQYAAVAQGEDPPLTTIEGPNTGLSTPTFVFVN